MRASSLKARTPATRHFPAHAPTALPPPYQLAIEDAPFRMAILEDHVPRDYDCDTALVPPSWFSVTLTRPPNKRYLYLVQEETDTGFIAPLLLIDRSASREDTDLRLPPGGAWLRAIVEGTVYVLASDLVLSRKSITAWLGAREPPPPAGPPYT